MKLFIIGNGFDLWHGLPTAYEKFYEFAKPLFDDIEEYYLSGATSAPWNDFENRLGQFDWKVFYEQYNHIDIGRENFKPSEAFGLEDELSAEALSMVDSLREQFQEWIETIEFSSLEAKIQFPKNSIFISFNYTSTLQEVYDIPDERVLHIHGKAEAYDELVFGHGEQREEEPELDENGDSNRTMFSGAEGAAKYPFYAFQKPVKDTIAKNMRMFANLHNVNEVVVVGHSLNNIDLPYFEVVSRSAAGAKWSVSYYAQSEKQHHYNQLLACGVLSENIRNVSHHRLEQII